MDNRILYGMMTLLLNSYGVPCFMRGEVTKGVFRIVLAVVTFGVIGVINFVKGLILGIRILNMTDAEFEEKKATLDSGIPS